MTCKTDIYIDILDNFEESVDLSREETEAVEAARDALAFAQALWTLFGDQMLHQDVDDEPDYYKMENIIDALNGEIAAAVLMLNSLGVDESLFLKNADNLEKHNGSLEGMDPVPQVVIEGNRRLAKRIKNTKIVMAAKNRTRLVAKKP